MRITKAVFFIFLSATFLWAVNYVDIYRKNGIKSVQKIFDKELISGDYWREYLKDYNTSLGYFEKSKYIITVDKDKKFMELYFADGKGKLKKMLSKSVIVGKKGEKKREGDLVTPVGTYRITMRFTPKDTYYGPLAFSLSYPNIFDKTNGRDGHGIWIHGYPLDHKKRPPVTKGCMVLKNEELKELNSTIDPQNTFVIIYENELQKVKKETLAKILAFLYSWKDAWKNNNIDKYLSFYDKSFKRFDGKNFEQFSKMKRAIFKREERKKIRFENILILPYPTTNSIKLYKILFFEKYKSSSGYKYNGDKVLYIKENSDKFKIIIEE